MTDLKFVWCLKRIFVYNLLNLLELFSPFQSSQNRLLIKNGRVVNDDGMEDADVYIEDGIIK